MSDQVSAAVDPGRAIYEALSDEAKAAVDALPDNLFEDHAGTSHVDRFVRSIGLAHQEGPQIWSILATTLPGKVPFVALNLQSVNVVSLSDRLRFAVQPDLVQEEALGAALDSFISYDSYAEHLKMVQVQVDATTPDHARAELERVHELVVQRLAGAGWAKNLQARNHRDDIRVKLAVLAREEIPAPSYVPSTAYGLRPVPAKNLGPGQALYDALSDEAKAAVDALPAAVFSGQNGISAAKTLAATIRFAHDVNPVGWLVSPDGPTNGKEMLSVICSGTRVVQLLNRSILALRYDEQSADPSVQDWMTSTGFKTNTLSRSPRIRRVYVPLSQLDAIPDTFWDAHRAAIEFLDDKNWLYGTGGRPWGWHKDPWRVRIAMVADEEVPAPGFMPPEKYGLVISDGTGGTDAPGYEDTYPDDFDVKSGLPERFADAGLTYTEAQVASFYTALQTKGFVILSGISGTGKSKIAQRFAQLIPAPAQRDGAAIITQDVTDPQGNPFYRVKIRNYMGKYQRFYVPAEVSASLPLPEPGTAFNVPLTINGISGEARIRVRSSGGAYLFPKGTTRTEFVAMTREHDSFYLRFQLNDTGDLIESVDISSEKPAQPDAIRVHMTGAAIKNRLIGFPWNQASKFPFPALKPSAKIAVRLPDMPVEGRLDNPNGAAGGNGIQLGLPQQSKEFFDALKVGDELIITPLVRDGLVAELTIDHPGAAGQPSQDTGANHLFLPVRPDWRDGKQLIGYHNPLSGEYVRTGFLDFVIAAADDFTAGNRNAFFVILDEMNLAHVEYYFADVLSVIESGRDDEGWTVEGIPLAVDEEDADLPTILRLPPNLYIVGTVNMDETTHPFSPKVLDRAFTIELTEVDFTGYPVSTLAGLEMGDGEKQALLDAFTRRGRYPRIDKGEIAAFVDSHERYRDDLQSLNGSLRRARMHFGYRTFDEIMQFVVNAELNGLFTADEAFDHAVLMKVLPKFNGSRSKLQNALFDLIHWCHTNAAPTFTDRSVLETQFATFTNVGTPFDAVVIEGSESEADWRYPATGRRAALMMQDLYTDGFASFG